MRRLDNIAVGGLVFVAVVAFILGLGTIVYAYAVVRPQMERVDAAVVAGLEIAEHGLYTLASHADSLEEAAAESRRSAVAATRALPAVLEQGSYLSWHAAQTLDQSARTLRAVAEATELVLPDDAIEQNATAMSTTARSLEGLVPQLDALRAATDTLAIHVARTSGTVEQLQGALRGADVTIEQAHTQLHRTHQAFQEADLVTGSALGTSMQGGLYLLLSVLLLGMAGLWKRLAVLSANSVRHSER